MPTVPAPLEDSSEDARERVLKALARIQDRASTGRLNGDSTLSKIQRKMKTRMGTEDDVERRRKYLEEAGVAEETPEEEEAEA